MATTVLPADLVHTLDPASRLPAADLPAAEALAAAMAGWGAAELADYRAAVLAEAAALGGRPAGGFLAVELAALVTVGDRGV